MATPDWYLSVEALFRKMGMSLESFGCKSVLVVTIVLILLVRLCCGNPQRPWVARCWITFIAFTGLIMALLVQGVYLSGSVTTTRVAAANQAAQKAQATTQRVYERMVELKSVLDTARTARSVSEIKQAASEASAIAADAAARDALDVQAVAKLETAAARTEADSAKSAQAAAEVAQKAAETKAAESDAARVTAETAAEAARSETVAIKGESEKTQAEMAVRITSLESQLAEMTTKLSQAESALNEAQQAREAAEAKAAAAEAAQTAAEMQTSSVLHEAQLALQSSIYAQLRSWAALTRFDTQLAQAMPRGTELAGVTWNHPSHAGPIWRYTSHDGSAYVAAPTMEGKFALRCRETVQRTRVSSAQMASESVPAEEFRKDSLLPDSFIAEAGPIS